MLARSHSLLDRLRNAIQKVKLLLSFSAAKWILSSTMNFSQPRLSFKDKLSLTDCTDEEYFEVGSSTGVSRTASSASEISRTTSDASTSDDIDRRAELFIANFYKHIQMERQVSLELRYCMGEEALERTKSY